MVEIKIDDTRINKALGELLAKSKNMRPAMKKVAGIMADAVEENFAQQGRPKWASLSRSTIKARTKSGTWPGSILQQSGSMAASIQSDTGDDYAQVGTNKKYAAIQHFGGTIKMAARTGTVRLRTTAGGALERQKGNSSLARFARINSRAHKRYVERSFTAAAHDVTIPARPFLKIEESDKEEILRSIGSYLTRRRS
jgi:phage virion morphogenesis protein